MLAHSDDGAVHVRCQDVFPPEILLLLAGLTFEFRGAAQLHRAASPGTMGSASCLGQDHSLHGF
jgi:hypothetical protein